MSIFGAALGAIGSIAGGIINNGAAKDAAREAAKNQIRIIKHQVEWMADSAKRAGIHPLAALGVNVANGPPPAQVFDSGLGEAGAALGEAVSRATDPMAKVAAAQTQLQLERSRLDNDFIRSQIASQRMKNIQQSTPGVRSTTGNDVLVNPFTQEPFPTKNPNLGQDAENAYSDVGGNVFGAGNLIADTLRNNGYDPRAFYDDPVGATAAALRGYTASQWQKADTYIGNNYEIDPAQYNWGY